MERVDLDAAQARFDKAAAHRFSGPSNYSNEHVADLASSAGDVPVLVEELRATRDVVDAVREFLDELERIGMAYPLERADRLAKLIDIAKARRP